ncbi:MAG: DUF3108 domain-containing protein [Candidatus Omnitrophica bacterium]|nr:DUF3108 domain-containing protein [Candidatus Omnitrophota bacterium]
MKRQRVEGREQKVKGRGFSTFYFLLSTLFLFNFAAGCARAGVYPAHSREISAGRAKQVSIAPPVATVPVGEKLEYSILWWGIPVGTATLTTEGPDKNGLIELSFNAHSNWYLVTFYPVTARLTSWMDPKTVSPRRFESYLKRQWRVHESVITFDPSTQTSLHELPEERKISVPVSPLTQDGLSVIYYARTLPVQLGKTIPLEISADGKNWALNGTVVQAGIVKIGSAGYWPALEGQVELAYPVPFFHGANARIWFSADEQRIPLLAKIRSRIGPVTVVMIRRTVAQSSS